MTWPDLSTWLNLIVLPLVALIFKIVYNDIQHRLDRIEQKLDRHLELHARGDD